MTRRQQLALLYLESIGNPPKFARTARHIGRTTPILTVAVGRSATGRRLAGARAAKTATPLITRQALFQQAGIIATANLGELLDTAALLASQPVPAGNRVGVVSNTRGAAVLAADACADAGLQIASLAGNTQQALRDILGPDSLVAGPVDTTVLVPPGSFRRSLEIVGADPDVDVVLALTTTTAGSDLVPEVSAARLTVPIAAAILDQVEVVRLLPRPATARTPAPSRPMPTPNPPPAPSATPRATASGGRLRRDTYPIWTACARTGHGNWSPASSPHRLGVAGCRWTLLWSCSAATASRWPTVSGSSAKKRQPRRRSGSAASSHSGRTCPACCAPATPVTC